jgi:hypothetical protein
MRQFYTFNCFHNSYRCLSLRMRSDLFALMEAHFKGKGKKLLILSVWIQRCCLQLHPPTLTFLLHFPQFFYSICLITSESGLMFIHFIFKKVKVAIIGITAGGVGLDFSSAQNVIFVELPKSASELLQVLSFFSLFAVAISFQPLLNSEWRNNGFHSYSGRIGIEMLM